jgi:hypothetical protein
VTAVTVWQIPDAVDTVVSAPDGGWKYHSKHVEQFPDINKLCNVASCWMYEYIGTLLKVHYILHISRIRVKPGAASTLLRQCNQTLSVESSPFIHSSAWKTVHHYVTRLLRKIVKSYYLLHHVCLSARNYSAPTGRIVMNLQVFTTATIDSSTIMYFTPH